MSTTGLALGGVLFDMDGLLVDSEPLWTVAETDLARDLGAVWSPQLKAAVIGTRLDAAVPIILRELGVGTDPATVARTQGWLLARMTALFTERALPLLPGARGLLDALTEAGVPCALVSSSYRVLVDTVLDRLGDHPFRVTIAGDEVAQAKPDPEPYRLAAEGLGAEPGSCVVLEDSVTGATAGVAAGCVTVLVPGGTVPPPAVAGGWLLRRSLLELDPGRLAGLLSPMDHVV